MGRDRHVVFLIAFGISSACTSETPVPPRPVAGTAEAIDAETVAIEFSAQPDSTPNLEAVTIRTAFRRPAQSLIIRSVERAGSGLRIRTTPQVGGELYTVRFGPLRFAGIEEADAPVQLNFRGYGEAQVELRLDTRGYVTPEAMNALVTIDPATGRYDARFASLPMSRVDGGFVLRFPARISEGVSFAARAVAPDGQPASALTMFSTTSSSALTVELPVRLPRIPEFTAPEDPTPGDGVAPVRIVVDDRYARALDQPALRASIAPDGSFDVQTQRLEPLRPVAGKPRIYEVVFDVKVDAARQLEGTTPSDFPYVTFLVEGGEDFSARGATFVMPEERPQVHVIPVGNLSKVPVTFRFDVKDAWLTPDGSARGLYPGEGPFLTGEFANAEDALGRLAADAFTGGERTTLEMRERADAPGVFEKTIFLPPGRPYGFKIVRCPTGEGCSALNRNVTSSGRAFPTVMKNLVTENRDASALSEVLVLDPASLAAVPQPDGPPLSFAEAAISLEGTEPPSNAVMFKQEAPDLVVQVGTEPIITPIYVVGTWRDVNIPFTPREIVENGMTINLGPYDYDDGLIGRAPPVRALELPADPGQAPRGPGTPAFRTDDGRLDPGAVTLGDAENRLPLWVSWNEDALYVASAPADGRSDHFIVISLNPPDGFSSPPWGKGGRAAGGRAIFLAQEGTSNPAYQAWFRRGAPDQMIDGAAGSGEVLEGQVRLSGEFAPNDGRVWIASVAYGTGDSEPLSAARQTPGGNGDENLDPSEFVAVELSAVRAP